MQVKYIFLINIFIIFMMPFVLAAEHEMDEDIAFFGLELEKVVNLGSGVLALILFSLTYAAYKRTRNKRLKYVSVAFMLFAIKESLLAHELFVREFAWVDPVASVFDIVILLVFFIGILRR